MCYYELLLPKDANRSICSKLTLMRMFFFVLKYNANSCIHMRLLPSPGDILKSHQRNEIFLIQIKSKFLFRQLDF